MSFFTLGCKIKDKTEKKSVDWYIWEKFKFIKKNKRLNFELRRLSNSVLINFPSPQFNSCRGIYHRTDHEYPAKDVKHNKGSEFI